MYRKSILLMFLLVSLFISSANSKSIIWVSGDVDGDDNGSYTDDWQDWIDKLEAEGYTVDVNPLYWNELTQDKVNELNAADLVIISRAIDSSVMSTNDAEVTLWNSVTTPILNCSPYVLRNTRWKWINNGDGTLPNNNGDQGSPLMQVMEPSHPIFWGITLGANNQVQVVNPDLGSGNCSFINTADVGNGTLIAKTVGENWVWIAEWQEGVEFYNGANAYANGHRMSFSAGAREGAVGGTDSYKVSEYNWTDEGWKIYLNAVKYMLGELDYKASSPNPKDEETDVVRNAILSWKAGISADSHNVYFGTDLDDVNNATISSHDNVTLTESLDVNNFDPGTLELGVTYYWRVDEVNAPSSPGSYKGQVWQFTVEPYA
ncbi:MAG: hypothetical protein JW787_09845, partial [Sedimentisphaerales bacterium]|nr:hypothetical protein [Sedimentisphaerales bacterium]